MYVCIYIYVSLTILEGNHLLYKDIPYYGGKSFTAEGNPLL